jgi:hypothetical protein
VKVHPLEEGAELQVGDYIKHDTPYRVAWSPIHRVTAKYAFVKYNDMAEGKFPRVYRSFTFVPLPRQRWDDSNYKPYRPVEPEIIQEAT